MKKPKKIQNQEDIDNVVKGLKNKECVIMPLSTEEFKELKICKEKKNVTLQFKK